MRRWLKNMLWLVAIVIVAQLDLQAEQRRCATTADRVARGCVVEAEGADHDYFAERTTHIALVPQSFCAPSASSRTLTLRQRTASGPLALAYGLGGGYPTCNNLVPGLLSGACGTSASIGRPADYYIYALRHIII